MNLGIVKAVQQQMADDLNHLVSGSAPSEAFNSPIQQAPAALPRLIEMTQEKYGSNATRTINELRQAADNLRAVADELSDAADQIEKDIPTFNDTLTSVVRYEMACAERVQRYLLIKPSGR